MKLKTIAMGILGIAAAAQVAAENSTWTNPTFQYGPKYKVTITNVTKGQSFTPILAAGHMSSVSFFTVGQPASDEISVIAEGGNVAPLQNLLESNNTVASTATSMGLLGPGMSTELMLTGNFYDQKLSMAAMLLPTNDTFFALNGVNLPRHGEETYYANAYDAGTEANDELCESIPGPHCGGSPFSAPSADDEGYVYFAQGIHGEGELSRAAYDWRGPVAKISVEVMY